MNADKLQIVSALLGNVAGWMPNFRDMKDAAETFEVDVPTNATEAFALSVKITASFVNDLADAVLLEDSLRHPARLP